MTRNYQEGGLAAAVSDPQETLAGSTYESQDEIVKRAKMQPSVAMSRLEEARQRLLQSRAPDPRGEQMARAAAYLSPTTTGQFGETMGNVARATSEYRTGEQKRLTDVDEALFKAEIALEKISEGYGLPSAIQEFENLTQNLSEEEVEKARRIELGLDPRAVGTGKITTALTEGLSELVADSEALIKERGKFAELTGASRAKTIDGSYKAIQGIQANVRNLDRAILALQEGASTGFVEQFFPSIREASIKLDTIQKELGLDVVGSVTFGALSKGELDLALSTALPTGLEPPELLEYLRERKVAQEKLKQYYLTQIDFLDKKGTIAGFLREQERSAGGQATDRPTVATQEEFDALPSGTEYIEDGQTYRKP